MTIKNKLSFPLILLLYPALLSAQILPPLERVNGDSVKAPLENVAEFAYESIVRITDLKGRPLATGISVDKNGLILTKGSELKDNNKVTLANGKTFMAVIVGIDESTDLSLLKINAQNLPSLSFEKDIVQTKGNWIISPLADGKSKIGIVSTQERQIKRVPGVLGIILGQNNDKGIFIRESVSNGPAFSSGIRDGDILTEIDQQKMKNRDDLFNFLKGKGPGTNIQVTFLRNGEQNDVELTLGDRSQTFGMFNRNLMMSGVVSKRIDGFPKVIQHDIPLEPYEAGSPVISLSGEVLGINIAKANRSESYALPNKVVRHALKKLKALKIPELKSNLKDQKKTTIAELKRIQQSLKKLLPKAESVTVGLENKTSAGSGVIISEDGYIATAAHVSGTPNQPITVVMPDGKKLKGKTLGSFLPADISLVKITEEGKYPFAKLGKAKNHTPGDWCFVLGYPGGFDKERGSVARIGKVIQILDNVLWTDCTLLGGDSGGPVFNFKGEVIGINSRVFTKNEQNYHGPADIYETNWEDLLKGKELTYPFLGVATSPNRHGLRVNQVVPGSSAAKAKLQTGDIITSIDDVKLDFTEELIRLLRQKNIGQEISIDILRNGQSQNLKVKLGSR